jgi:assimilatory nitrate reductase electron transfer subunit
MRVVVAGYGMAGARLAEEIRAHDPDGSAVRLTVLGAEPHHAYNRVLLSTVLTGRLDLDAIGLHDAYWAEKNQVDLRLDCPVTAIDRTRRHIRLANGSTVDYDHLVLATGSRARIPSVEGLSGVTVCPLRTVDDCARIIERARRGTPVAVLGGGLLGLEAARGLAERGCRVTVVQHRRHLMERQLDAPAAGVLARSLARLGVGLRLGVHAVRYAPGTGLTLSDGSELPVELVVVSAGVRAETGLAQEAGLTVDQGILVDDRLRTSDPRIAAIGDCARHASGGAGLVQPAWEQASVLAALLTGADPGARYTGTPMVTRLKARDVDLAALGEVHTTVEDPDAEVIQVQDPARGRSAKLVLRADRVTGAILLGVPDAAATVIQLYDSGALAPGDRLALLLGRALPAGVSTSAPGDLPGSSVLCRCNTVSKATLVAAWRDGARDLTGLANATRATTGCGGCRDAVSDLLEWLSAAEPA